MFFPQTDFNRILTNIIVCCLLWGLATTIKAQEPIGGPYESDSATVLLLHLDDSLRNASGRTEDPKAYGNISYLEMNGAGEFDKQVRFDNDSPDDRSHLQVPDTAALDLTGSWTIEFWVNTFCFCTFPLPDWYDNASFILKPAYDTAHPFPDFTRQNYGVLTSIKNRSIESRYYSENERQLFNLAYPDLHIGEWYHVAFIRDTTRNLLIQMIHQNAENPGRLPDQDNDALEMVYFDALSYVNEESDPVPITSDHPLFIAGAPAEDTLHNFLDGFADEIRISNVVRNFAMPPAITNVSQLLKQPDDRDYTIEAEVEPIAENELGDVMLHYRVDSTDWRQVSMTRKEGDTFAATIPSQSAGSKVHYRITAVSQAGLQASKPVAVDDDTNSYEFGVWEEESQVLELDFEQAEEGQPPVDRSQFENPFTVAGTPRYPEVEGRGQVLELSAEDSTSLVSRSDFLALPQFAIEMDFQVRDSLPEFGDMMLIKESDERSGPNYHVGFEGDQVWVFTTIPDLTFTSVLPPRWTIADTSITPDTWYRLQFSYRPDTLRARLFSGKDSTYLGGVTATFTVDNFAHTTTGPFRIGTRKTIDQTWFNGRLDNVKIYNYVPQRFRKTYTATPADKDLPRQTRLSENYPNPFNPTTRIRFSLPKTTEVQLTVYDMLGRRVETLVAGRRQAGRHEVTFRAEDLASGMYLYRLETDDFSQTRKMLLVK